MDKFIIANVHDATPKKSQKQIPNFILFFLLVKNNPCLKKMIKIHNF